MPISSLIYLLVDLMASIVKVYRIRILVSSINIEIIRLVLQPLKAELLGVFIVSYYILLRLN